MARIAVVMGEGDEPHAKDATGAKENHGRTFLLRGLGELGVRRFHGLFGSGCLRRRWRVRVWCRESVGASFAEAMEAGASERRSVGAWSVSKGNTL